MAHCIDTTARNISQLKMGSQIWGLVSNFQASTYYLSCYAAKQLPCFPKNWFAKEHAWDSRANLASLTCPYGSTEKISRLSPVSLFAFILASGLLFHRSCALDQRINTDCIAVCFYFRFFNQDNQNEKEHAFVCTLIWIPVMNDRSVRTHCWNCLKTEAHEVFLLSEIKKMKQNLYQERGTSNETGKWKKRKKRKKKERPKNG